MASPKAKNNARNELRNCKGRTEPGEINHIILVLHEFYNPVILLMCSMLAFSSFDPKVPIRLKLIR